MLSTTDDLRIRELKELSTPEEVMREIPRTLTATRVVMGARNAIHGILGGTDDRLLVIVGPCSIHDPAAAIDYATRLAGLRERLANQLEIVMRVYFEKPRTIVGWKGLINDPDLDGSFNINKGLRLARRLLCEINDLGLPAGVEYLDTISPQYISDLVAWGAIGARTTESQIHRELASGLSCPVGFKNGTDGNVRIAVDAIRAASVDAAARSLAEAGVPARLMIDFSHGNSSKKPEKQLDVAQDVAGQIAGGEARIFGIMAESHLKAGRQDLVPGKELVYGMSITDGCIGWEDSRKLLGVLADGVARRRLKAQQAE